VRDPSHREHGDEKTDQRKRPHSVALQHFEFSICG